MDANTLAKDRIVSYMVYLTKVHLEKHFGVDHFQEFYNEFFKLLEEEYDEEIEMRHLVNAPFVIALYNAIKNDIESLERYEKHAMVIYRDIIDITIKMMRSRIRNAENKWEAFVDGVRRGNDEHYDNEHFQLEVLEDSAENYNFVLKNCYYFEVLSKRGYEHLGPVLCKYDYLIPEGLDQWVKFSRGETIANGHHKCDFSYAPKRGAFEKNIIPNIRRKAISKLFFKCRNCGFEEEASWEFVNKQSSKVEEIRDIPLHCDEQMSIAIKSAE